MSQDNTSEFSKKKPPESDAESDVPKEAEAASSVSFWGRLKGSLPSTTLQNMTSSVSKWKENTNIKQWHDKAKSSAEALKEKAETLNQKDLMNNLSLSSLKEKAKSSAEALKEKAETLNQKDLMNNLSLSSLKEKAKSSADSLKTHAQKTKESMMSGHKESDDKKGAAASSWSSRMKDLGRTLQDKAGLKSVPKDEDES